MIVAVSTSILGDVVSRICGDVAELTILMKPGQDPHSFEPTPRMLTGVSRAHLVFVNGLGLEEGMMDLITSVATGKIVEASRGVEVLEVADHGHGGSDPHVWTDPANATVWVANIEKAVCETDPDNCTTYRENAAAYLADLERADTRIRERLDGIPPGERQLVTDHDMLGYFARAYGFEVTATLLPGMSTSLDVPPGRISQVVDLLRERDVRTIFVGSTAGQGIERLAQAVSREIGGEVRIVRLLTGSLALQGEPGDTYLGYLDYNVEQILHGLAH